MAIPSYISITDENGAIIKGGSKVNGRENDIEVLSFTHNLYLPSDGSSGRLNGSRVHKEISFEKEFDSSSPYLYKALSTGSMLKNALIKWYRINESGSEEEYFHIKLSNVKITSITPTMYNIKEPDKIYFNHLESICMRYEKITWIYLDGNIQFTDQWTSNNLY